MLAEPRRKTGRNRRKAILRISDVDRPWVPHDVFGVSRKQAPLERFTASAALTEGASHASPLRVNESECGDEHSCAYGTPKKNSCDPELGSRAARGTSPARTLRERMALTRVSSTRSRWSQLVPEGRWVAPTHLRTEDRRQQLQRVADGHLWKERCAGSGRTGALDCANVEQHARGSPLESITRRAPVCMRR